MDALALCLVLGTVYACQGAVLLERHTTAWRTTARRVSDGLAVLTKQTSALVGLALLLAVGGHRSSPTRTVRPRVGGVLGLGLVPLFVQSGRWPLLLSVDFAAAPRHRAGAPTAVLG